MDDDTPQMEPQMDEDVARLNRALVQPPPSGGGAAPTVTIVETGPGAEAGRLVGAAYRNLYDELTALGFTPDVQIQVALNLAQLALSPTVLSACMQMRSEQQHG